MTPSLQVIVYALSSELLYPLYDSLGEPLHLLVLVLEELRQERNGVVENHQIALAHSVKEVFCDLQCGEPSLPSLTTRLHHYGIVELLPAAVIVDTLVHVEDEGLHRCLDEAGEV